MRATFLPGVLKNDGQNVPGVMPTKPKADESEDAFDSVFGDLEAMQRPSHLSGNQLEADISEVADKPAANTAATPSHDKGDIEAARSEPPVTADGLESEILGKGNPDLVTKSLRTSADIAAVPEADTIDQTGPALEPDQMLPHAIASKQSNFESAPAHVVGIRTGTAAAFVNGIAFGGPNSAETFVHPPASPATKSPATPEARRESMASSFQPNAHAAYAEPNEWPLPTGKSALSDPGKTQMSVAPLTNDVLPAKDFETKMEPVNTPDRTRRSPRVLQASFEPTATTLQTPSRHAPSLQDVQQQTRASATTGSDRIQHVPSDVAENTKLDTRPQLTAPGVAKTISTDAAGIQQLRVADANVAGRIFQLPNDKLEEVAWDIRPQLTPSGTANAVAASRAEMPPQIAQLVTEAMHRSPDKAIEIALSPAELGRVRMVLTTSEGGIIVNILAERADTLDLMRRNIDDLGRSFSELGYADISFAFGKGGDASDNPDPPTKENAIGDALSLEFTDSPAVPDTAQSRLAIVENGVDMRV